MSDAVHWNLEFKAKDGRTDEVRQLMNEMVDATRDSEPGALSYEWVATQDGSTWQIYERYADSAATVEHMNNFFKNFVGRFMEVAEPRRFDVYGDPDDKVREILTPMRPRYMASQGGFTR